MNLLLRKIAIAFAVGFGGYFVVAAPDLIGLFELQDWNGLKTAGWAVVIGGAAAGLRALLALLTAFVPSDAENGVNLVGKFSDEPPSG
jgi:hypothetical protein